jgi:hypothetical protein
LSREQPKLKLTSKKHKTTQWHQRLKSKSSVQNSTQSKTKNTQAYRARVEAGIADQEKADREMLAGLDDKNLKLFTLEAQKIAKVVSTQGHQTPKQNTAKLKATPYLRPSTNDEPNWG